MATSTTTSARPTSGTWARRARQPQRHLLTLDGLRRQRQRGARSVARRGGDVDLDGLRLRAQRGVNRGGAGAWMGAEREIA